MFTKKNDLIKKLLAIALALTVGVTFIPLLGDQVYAEGEDADTGDVIVDVNPDDETVPAEEVEDPSVPENIERTCEAEDFVVPEENKDPAVPGSDEASLNDEESLNTDILSAFEPGGQMKAMAGTLPYTVSVKRSGTNLIINASFTSSYQSYKKTNLFFREIFVDGKHAAGTAYKNALVDFIVPLSDVGGTGYHTVNINFYGKSGSSYIGLYATDDVYYRVGVKDAPPANGTISEVHHNYILYTSPFDYSILSTAGRSLRMQYSTNGKTWVNCGPAMGSGTYYTISGFRPNTTYRLRTYYQQTVNGTTYTSAEEGKYRYLGTYRTGVGSKVAVKSIKVKAYKVKKKKQKVYGYYTGLYLGKRTYWKYKLKIEVKLKKKPGTAGIWINGKRYKGNKKKYTVKLGSYTSYSKPKGKKFTVAIYKYHNTSWGGYSPMYKKVKKIK